MDEVKRKDDELFEALNKSKKKKRRKKLLTALIIVAVIVAALLLAFSYLRGKVAASIASAAEEVMRYTAEYGNISTRVSGSGTIEDVDPEDITLTDGVEIDEVIVEASAQIREGDVIATLDQNSILSAMASVQEDIESLDSEIASAASDRVSSSLSAGVKGRVKKLYAETGQDVASCMMEHGALALLSLDGYMAVDLETDALRVGDGVRVLRANGGELTGTVESAAQGRAVILVTDNGPELGETVAVLDGKGKELGNGALYIHNEFRVTGFTGTVSQIWTQENEMVYASSTLYLLTDTAFSANYARLLKQREAKEETLLELLELYRRGALCAPFDGTVLTVEYDEDKTARTADGELLVITLARDEEMSATISVDEMDILALQLGQSAEITIDSLGGETFLGTVTDIDKTAASSSGVTAYSATVSFPKAERMLGGMSAEVVISIVGTENVLLVPADAIHKTSATAFVYTEYDEETGEYGGMRTVEIGISNEDFAQILSGLQAGDVVYYTEKETAASVGFGGGPNPFG